MHEFLWLKKWGAVFLLGKPNKKPFRMEGPWLNNIYKVKTLLPEKYGLPSWKQDDYEIAILTKLFHNRGCELLYHGTKIEIISTQTKNQKKYFSITQTNFI